MNTFHLVHSDTLSCEAIVRQVPNGDLLMIAQCKGPIEPHPDNRVFFWHSKDGGESWDMPTKLWPEDGQTVYQTEVSVIGDRVLVFLALHNGNFLDWKCVVAESKDSGYTWEKSSILPYFSNFTFFRGMIECTDHTLIQAYQRYPVTTETNRRLKMHNKKIWDGWEQIPWNENGVIRSEDGGKTWQHYPVSRLMNDEKIWHWGEPTVCELEEGHLVMLLRVNGNGYLWRSDSQDGGRHWTKAIQTDIPNPNNKSKLLRLPDGRIALLHTPTGIKPKKPKLWPLNMSDRNPLEIWISSDNMKTWEYKEKILDFPGAISYPDGFSSSDGHQIHLSIEFNRHDIYYIIHEIETWN